MKALMVLASEKDALATVSDDKLNFCRFEHTTEEQSVVCLIKNSKSTETGLKLIFFTMHIAWNSKVTVFKNLVNKYVNVYV